MKTALITGASGGIGLELAKLFAQDGYHLVLVARSREKLETLAQELQSQHQIQALCLAKDLSRPEAPKEILEQLNQSSIPVDVLVNNAGFSQYGYFHQTDTQRQLEMIRLNITALTELTHLFLKSMMERKQGRILNVASTAAFQAGPLMAVYYATKAYVLSFSEALRNELKGTGVTVTVLCPGPTATGFQEAAEMGRMPLLAPMFVMKAGKAAKAGYRGLMKNRAIVIPGFFNKLFAFATRLAPRAVNTAAVRLLQSPM